MSATAIWTVHCHGIGVRSEDCYWWVEGNPDETKSQSERGARQLGWEVTKNGNRCPACIRDQS